MGYRSVRVGAGPGFFDRDFADVGGENLEREAHFSLLQKLHQADGDRISFLARGAPWNPDPDWILASSILHQRWEHLLRHFVEDGWFAEEFGDGDKEALAQRVGFLVVLLEIPAVVVQRFEPSEGHAPLDAPLEGAGLVVREVHSGGGSQQPEYPLHFAFVRQRSRLPRPD